LAAGGIFGWSSSKANIFSNIITGRETLVEAAANTPPFAIRWNDLAGASEVDVIVHLHGHVGLKPLHVNAGDPEFAGRLMFVAFGPRSGQVTRGISYAEYGDWALEDVRAALLKPGNGDAFTHRFTGYWDSTIDHISMATTFGPVGLSGARPPASSSRLGSSDKYAAKAPPGICDETAVLSKCIGPG
jgi:hypothetical protein